MIFVDVRIRGSVLTFQRKVKTFRGRLRNDADCFAFKRVSQEAV